MFTHNCQDPQDPFAEREVRVAFEIDAAGIRLLAATDEDGHDILPDLVEVQRDDLLCEVAAWHACRGISRPRSGTLSSQAPVGATR